MKNTIGFLEFDFKEQKKAFNYIYDELLKKLPIEVWSFGGGTALSMFYFQHRASFDIDIFINDPQYFSFLSPKFYIEETDFLQSDYYIETANQISLKTKNNIKIDFLLTPPLTKKFAKTIRFEGKNIQIDTIEEIIAKKIFYRYKDNKSRDILDIAVALHQNPNILNCLMDESVNDSNNGLNLDILYEFQKMLKIEFNRDRFLKDISILEISDYTKEVIKDIPNIIIDNINFVLKIKKEALKSSNKSILDKELEKLLKSIEEKYEDKNTNEIKEIKEKILKNIDFNTNDIIEKLKQINLIVKNTNEIEDLIELTSFKEFNAEQLKEIRVGLENNENIYFYAKPELSADRMKIIRKSLNSNKKVEIDTKNSNRIKR